MEGPPSNSRRPGQSFRLECSQFWVDVRLREFNGGWLASADTVDGPSLGTGLSAFEALWSALQPFDGVIGELLATVPRHVVRLAAGQSGRDD